MPADCRRCSSLAESGSDDQCFTCKVEAYFLQHLEGDGTRISQVIFDH
ncbi:hypothetical protein B9479_007555, partial [Cryptococcus floricola]